MIALWLNQLAAANVRLGRPPLSGFGVYPNVSEHDCPICQTDEPLLPGAKVFICKGCHAIGLKRFAGQPATARTAYAIRDIRRGRAA